MAVAIGTRTQKWLRYAGVVAFAMVALVMFLQMTFPYDRVKDRLIDAVSTKYELKIGKVERGLLPGRVTFRNMTFFPYATKPGETPAPFTFDAVTVDLGLLALVRSTAVVNVDVEVGGKHLTGEFEFSKQSFTVKIDGDAIPAKKLPMREFAVFPVSGGLNVHVDLKSGIDRGRVDWSKLVGKIALACPKGCELGDGSYVKFPTINARSEAMVGKGVQFGPLLLESFLTQIDIAKGVAKIGKWEFKSVDGEAKLEAEVKLDKVFDSSMIDGCVRYKPTDELRKRNGETFSQIMLIGGLLGSDGMFQVKLSGTMGRIRKVGQECDVAATSDKRPNLTVTPDEVFGAKNEGKGSGNAGSGSNVVTTMPVVPIPPPVPVSGSGSGAGSNPVMPDSMAKPAPGSGEPSMGRVVPPGEGTAGAGGVGIEADPANPAPTAPPPPPPPADVQPIQ
jgi:type II secretion system protein N